VKGYNNLHACLRMGARNILFLCLSACLSQGLHICLQCDACDHACDKVRVDGLLNYQGRRCGERVQDGILAIPSCRISRFVTFAAVASEFVVTSLVSRFTGFDCFRDLVRSSTSALRLLPALLTEEEGGGGGGGGGGGKGKGPRPTRGVQRQPT